MRITANRSDVTSSSFPGAEELLSGIFESIPSPLFLWDRNHICLFTNRSAIDYLRKTRDDVVGREMAEYLGPAPDIVGRWSNRADQILETGRSLRVKDVLQNKGEDPPREFFLSPVRYGKGCVFGVICLCLDISTPMLHERRAHRDHVRVAGDIEKLRAALRDVTGRLEEETGNRRQAEEALRKEEEYYRRFLSSAPVAIAIYSDNKFLFSNMAHTKLMGATTSAELVGRHVLEVIEEGYHDLFRERHRAILEKGDDVPLTAYKCRRLDGVLIDVETIAIPFIYRGKQVVMGIALDVTEQKKVEEELRSQREQLIRADKLASLGTCVSGVAHEISNPNNFIMLNASLLIKVWSDLIPLLDSVYRDQGEFRVSKMKYSLVREKMPVLCSDILEGSRRIKHIVKELKDFARPEKACITGAVDLNEVVSAAVSLLNNLIKGSTKRFSNDFGKNLPMVKGNFQRLEQVIVNLIMNACQALTAPEQAIQISTHFDKGASRVIVTIRDEGVGIAPDDLPRIMDPFFTNKRDCGGTGLGLSISSRIIADHGATLEFTSIPGIETVATIIFPLSKTQSMVNRK